ncbi:exported hypothetical protein [Verrucomicrobia bacterium]|nr:exported hypothetical protein [Verrucomicrobiota bacterium]
MAETTVPSPTPKKRHRGLRVLAWVVLVLVVLLVVAYFVGTSSAFLKGVILPRVGKSLNAQVTVSDASISPFKQIVLRNLKVQTTGTEPLLLVPEVLLRYRLLDIIGGKIDVEEIALSAPTVVVVENPDGTSNLDPLLKSQPKPASEAKPQAPGKPSKPAQLDLQKITLTDGTFRKIKKYRDGNQDMLEVSQLNVGVEGVKNGQAGKLTLSAALNAQQHPPAPATNGLLQAKLQGAFSFSLTADAQPASFQGTSRLEVSRAEGALAPLAQFNSDLNCDVTPAEIKEVALRLASGGRPLGTLRVSGPFDLAKTEGRLTIEILAIDKTLLNLASAGKGLDFGPTTINSTNQIVLANAGASITASGALQIAKLEVTRTNLTTPQVNLDARYDVTVDRQAGTALLRTASIQASRAATPFLVADLTSPMTLAWANTSNSVGDAALNLTLTNFDLAEWKALLEDTAPAGVINATLKLRSRQGGAGLTCNLDSRLDHLTFGSGDNQVSQAQIALLANLQVTGFKQFDLSQFTVQIPQAILPNKKRLSVDLTASGSGSYGPQGETALKAKLQVTNLVVSDPQTQTSPAPLQGSLQLDAVWHKQIADLHLLQLGLTPTSRASNQVQLTGQIDLSQPNATQGNLKLAADSLDLSSYYDLLAATNKAQSNQPGATTGTKPTPSQAPTTETEPAAKQLPVRNFVAQASIHRLYLHEVELADWETTLKLDGSHVALQPFKLSINGAPANLSADLDLSVPGYKYDLSLGAQAIPLAPLVNTFEPERKGQLEGTFTGQAHFAGIGTTGPSLQKNLSGQFDLSSTNLNLHAVDIKSPLLKTLVNVIGTLPELIQNPAGAVGNLFGGLTGASSGGLSGELSRSPINAIIGRGTVGSGRVDLSQAVIRSPAFEADTQGTISLAPVLNDSTIQLPVAVLLNYSIAQRLNLVPAGTPTNAPYAKLPDFLTMAGTLGKPKSQINKTVLATTALKGIGGAVPAAGGKIGNILGGLLPGSSTANTNAPTSTNASPANNLLNDLFKPKK